ncbi:MAG TPA: sigma-70 family RNA polymerase sigma factor [Solirubrobacteraceae bacterium]|nr:sigma-70 family RNA polymerase sigma factor [Solirubrobacteraceae bacterium]
MRASFRRAGDVVRGRSRHERLADEELMSLAARGDADAFELVYDRHSGVAYSLAYRICGRAAITDEVLQDAFLAVWRTAERYEPQRGSVRSWILRIVHNRAIDAVRRAALREQGSGDADEIIAGIAGPGDTQREVLDAARARDVGDALSALPSEQGRVVELAYFGGFTHTEIARMLDMPVGTVKGRMRLALAKLRLSLDAYEETG